MEIKHNDASRQFMQKILLFIDSILINAISGKDNDNNKTLANGLLNIKDALLSEIVRDNYLIQKAQKAIEEEAANAKKNHLEEKDQKYSNQEKKLDSDQIA